MTQDNQSLRDRATLTDERRSEIEIDYHENSGHNVTHLIRDVVYEERDHALRVVLEAVEPLDASDGQRSVTDQLRHCTGGAGADFSTIKLRLEQGLDPTEAMERLWEWLEIVDEQILRIEAALANFRRWQAEVQDG